MRRSSWLVLATASLLFAFTSLFYLHSFTSPAPPMTTPEAERWLNDARRSFESGNTGAVVNLITLDGKFMGRTRDQLREILDKTMREITTPLRVKLRNVQARQFGKRATVSFTMDVGQKTDKMDVVYFPGINVQLQLVKVNEPRWFGLASADVWKIVQADSDGTIEMPDLQ